MRLVADIRSGISIAPLDDHGAPPFFPYSTAAQTTSVKEASKLRSALLTRGERLAHLLTLAESTIISDMPSQATSAGKILLNVQCVCFTSSALTLGHPIALTSICN